LRRVSRPNRDDQTYDASRGDDGAQRFHSIPL
jgi:hypothetical protein